MIEKITETRNAFVDPALLGDIAIPTEGGLEERITKAALLHILITCVDMGLVHKETVKGFLRDWSHEFTKDGSVRFTGSVMGLSELASDRAAVAAYERLNQFFDGLPVTDGESARRIQNKNRNLFASNSDRSVQNG